MAKTPPKKVVADRVAPAKPAPPPPPKFTLPPRFTPPPPYFVAPPKFTIPPAFVVDGQKALAKLTGGQKLTDAEKKYLGIGGTTPPKKTPPKTPPYFVPRTPPKFTITKPKPEVVEEEPTTITEGTQEDVQEEVVSGGVSAEPYFPPSPPPPPPPPPVKSAPIDTILFDDDAVPKEIIADLLFEDIGGQEILTIARHDTVNGQSVLYQPIKNINVLQQQYNPNNLLKLRDTSDTIFGNFSINLFDKIPSVGNGANGSNVYLDSSGNIILEFVNLNPDEIIEVQLTSNGTIYEAG